MTCESEESSSERRSGCCWRIVDGAFTRGGGAKEREELPLLLLHVACTLTVVRGRAAGVACPLFLRGRFAFTIFMRFSSML